MADKEQKPQPQPSRPSPAQTETHGARPPRETKPASAPREDGRG